MSHLILEQVWYCAEEQRGYFNKAATVLLVDKECFVLNQILTNSKIKLVTLKIYCCTVVFALNDQNMFEKYLVLTVESERLLDW